MRTLVSCLCALLTGCAALAPGASMPVAVGEHFHVTGRVALRYADEAASGRIEWTHAPASDDLLLSSPLGQGLAHVTRQDGQVRLVTSDQKERVAQDAESLTEQVLGWRLPLAGLPHWVRALPAPGAPAQTRNGADGRLRELKQSGWRVEYLDYAAGSGLPTRMRLAREDLEIRLAIDTWRGER